MDLRSDERAGARELDLNERSVAAQTTYLGEFFAGFICGAFLLASEADRARLLFSINS
ncbi:hypothetical protein ACVJGD_008752 [Bradyrhizobium sp. USDA 10063]